MLKRIHGIIKAAQQEATSILNECLNTKRISLKEIPFNEPTWNKRKMILSERKKIMMKRKNFKKYARRLFINP